MMCENQTTFETHFITHVICQKPLMLFLRKKPYHVFMKSPLVQKE